MKKSSIRSKLLAVLSLIILGYSAYSQAMSKPLKRPVFFYYDVSIQSISVDGYDPPPHCETGLRTYLTVIIKNKEHTMSPPLHTELTFGEYQPTSFSITSVNGVAISTLPEASIRINPDQSAVIKGYIKIGPHGNVTQDYAQFKTRVYDDGSLTNVKERFTGDNEKTFGIDLAILKSISPDIFGDYKFCECLPPAGIIIDTSKYYYLMANVLNYTSTKEGTVPYYDPRPAYEKNDGDVVRVDFGSDPQEMVKCIVKLKIPEITAPGDKPKYEIVYRNDNRYVVFTAAGVKASSSPGGNMGFFNLRFDKAPDEYNIFQASICAVLETRQDDRGQYYIGLNSVFSGKEPQLFVLKPIAERDH